MSINRSRTAGAGAALIMALGLTASTISTAQASPAPGEAVANAAMGSSGMDFGPGCASVPKSGAGSFSGMTSAPVATAASHNPLLSTLVTAVKKAGLVDTLNNAKGLTVFAPDNAAFAKVPAKTLSAILANKMELTSILEYHVLAGRVVPGKLDGKHKTLEGSTLKVTGMGTSFKVNGVASVVCGNVQTANATVYIISSVLLPASK